MNGRDQQRSWTTSQIVSCVFSLVTLAVSVGFIGHGDVPTVSAGIFDWNPWVPGQHPPIKPLNQESSVGKSNTAGMYNDSCMMCVMCPKLIEIPHHTGGKLNNKEFTSVLRNSIEQKFKSATEISCNYWQLFCKGNDDNSLNVDTTEEVCDLYSGYCIQ